MSDLPAPPAPEGCRCVARDGEPSDNDRWPEWLTAGCPVHDRAGAVREAGGQAAIDPA